MPKRARDALGAALAAADTPPHPPPEARFRSRSAERRHNAKMRKRKERASKLAPASRASATPTRSRASGRRPLVANVRIVSLVAHKKLDVDGVTTKMIENRMAEDKVPSNASEAELNAREDAELRACDNHVPKQVVGLFDVLRGARLTKRFRENIANSRSNVHWRYGHFRRALGHVPRVEFPPPVYRGPPGCAVKIVVDESTTLGDVMQDLIILARAWAAHFDDQQHRRGAALRRDVSDESGESDGEEEGEEEEEEYEDEDEDEEEEDLPDDD